ncbi:Midasin [Glycine soja]|uniref:Midasin n=1 Tax=Glycine soja TaxID=3848 RepID=A0A445ILK0_GLYSO|nr:Midasin [Glycine soja]
MCFLISEVVIIKKGEIVEAKLLGESKVIQRCFDDNDDKNLKDQSKNNSSKSRRIQDSRRKFRVKNQDSRFKISRIKIQDDGTLNTSGDASGTSMGKGVGLKDVSDQIADEDQWLGTREQHDDSNEVPSSNNTWIEMEQDFEVDAQSLSEDSGEDNDIDGENGELESEMGPIGPNSEVVAEKGDETASLGDEGDGGNANKVNMDKEAAYSKTTRLKPDVLDQASNMNMNLDIKEDVDLMEGEPDVQGHDQQEDTNMNFTQPKKYASKSSKLIDKQVSPTELASQSKVDWQTSGTENVTAESNLSNSHHDFDPTLLGGLPSSNMFEMDVKIFDSSNSGGEMDDDNAHEHGYVSEFEKETTQALGPALVEQVDRNIDCDKFDKECLTGEDAKLQFEKKKSEMNSLSLHEKDLGKGQDPCDVPNYVKDNAITLWKRFELSTTKLSLKLDEQLHHVMEPTVASKLQGDYKIGKRINMKKVIPYITSDYKSCCGDVAIEALVIVCPVVSQLEMGSLVVASFGTKGNIKLLHDFDKPFTGKVSVKEKMISNLTFKEENTIVDEPVVNLLKYLTNKLDVALAKARLPSRHNPLQVDKWVPLLLRILECDEEFRPT